MPPLEQTTRLALDLGKGDRVAGEPLVPLVYDELRELAARYMGRERSGHTLQPTALVNEVYLRLVDADKIDWRG
ncbi:MAG: RNA polymerase subunit sigma-70, partial [Planctomycetes bacterium]|nr:RNA polymerase subunit sigma-70 [Planctomycetota bacterium]